MVMLAVQKSKVNNYEETIKVISKGADTIGELPQSVKGDNDYEKQSKSLLKK